MRCAWTSVPRPRTTRATVTAFRIASSSAFRSKASCSTSGRGRARSFAFEIEVPYTHEAWRGRMRACNGVIALGPRRVAEHDAALALVLAERFPEPLLLRHEVFALTARAP